MLIGGLIVADSHASRAVELLQHAHQDAQNAPTRAVIMLGAAGVHAVLEIAVQARHVAQALVLLTQPANTTDHTSRLAALADRVDHPEGPDPAGNLAQLLEDQFEERAARHDEGETK